MFARLDTADLGMVTPAHEDRQRSQSRVPGNADSHQGGTATAPALSTYAWSTGNGTCDAWLMNADCEPDVLDRFATMPQKQRKRIILRCMENPVDNIDAWLSACVRNYEDKQLELRTIGSPARRAIPYPRSAQGSDLSPAASSSGRSSQESRVCLPAPPPVSTPGRDLAAVTTALNVDIPQISRDLFACWPNNKSRCIAIVLGMLQGGVLAAFVSLTSQDQAAMAFALMVALPQDAEIRNQMLNAWMERLDLLRGGNSQQSMPMTVSNTPGRKICKVQCIVAGMPTCMAAVTISAVQKVVDQLHREVRWDFCPVIYLSEEFPDKLSVVEVFEAMRVSVRAEVSSLSLLVNELRNLWTEWAVGETNFVLVSCLSPGDRDGSFPPLEPHLLHEKPRRWMWGMVNLAKALRGKVGDERVAELMISPPGGAADYVNQVSTLYGQAIMGTEQTDVEKFACTLRPDVFCTPSGVRYVPCCEYSIETSSPIDGWTSPPTQSLTQVQQLIPRFVPSTLIQLTTDEMFNQRVLSADEQTVLATLRMRHSSGEDRLCHRPLWLRWMGFHDTPAQRLLTNHLPCLGRIIPSTGTLADEGLPPTSTSSCGQKRFCNHCEEVLTILSCGYQTWFVADVLVALFTKALPTWTHQPGAAADMWGRYAVARDHVCGEGCPHIRQ